MEDLSPILPSGSPVTVLRDTYIFTFLGCSSKEFVYTYISCMYSGASFIIPRFQAFCFPAPSSTYLTKLICASVMKIPG